jgi:hypothetical protein
MEIDGDSEYGLSGVLYAPPCEDTADGEYPDLPDGVEYEDAEDGRNWSEHNGAWLICEIFPEADPREGTPVYESIASAFSEDLLKAFPPSSDESPDGECLPFSEA